MLTDSQIKKLKVSPPEKKTPDKYSDGEGFQLHLSGRREYLLWFTSHQMGYVNGGCDQAQLYGPTTVTVDHQVNLYVGDNYTVRKITLKQMIETLAGQPQESHYTDGSGTAARFKSVSELTMGTADNLYVTDCLGMTVRKMTPQGVVTTIAGQPEQKGLVDVKARK